MTYRKGRTHRTHTYSAAFALAWMLMPAPGGNAAPATSTPRVEIDTSDVDLFYKVYDAAGGAPTAQQIDGEYLDKGSPGLKTLARLRNVTGQRIVDAMTANPALYSDARRCSEALPRARERLDAALHKFGSMYEGATFPPVTIAISRGKPIAVAGPDTGIQVGFEALCGVDWINPSLEDRIVSVLAHEYAHVQQPYVRTVVDKKEPTVLEIALSEGIAEFVAELIAGGIAYTSNAEAARGRELEIESAFVADIDSTDLSRWAYNSSQDTPGDLAYWVGYRIAKAYYRSADDKRQALREILEMDDPKAFLARSGWYPGIDLEAVGAGSAPGD